MFTSLVLAKVNINTARQEELASLPHIGTVKAKNIVSYRESQGKFSSVEDLLKVKGIGPKILEKIRADICVGKDLNRSYFPPA